MMPGKNNEEMQGLGAKFNYLRYNFCRTSKHLLHNRVQIFYSGFFYTYY